MATLSIALLVSAGIFSATYFLAGFALAWSVVSAVAGFLAFQVLVGLKLKKCVTADMARVQEILSDGQKRLQEKMQRWQFRPPGSVQAAQREMFEDTKVFVRAALKETERLSRYRLWVPMIERQKATAQLQLNWMIKDFDRVDALMPKALLFDPTMTAMKLARLQMLGRPLDEIRAAYAKGVRRLRYNQNVLPAACFSWILVRRGENDAAFKVLTDALKTSDNEVLRRNHELLMNDRVGHFSNSGLGDPWYSLMLEEPKIHTQRARSVYR
jgi:hypothetical protein